MASDVVNSVSLYVCSFNMHAFNNGVAYLKELSYLHPRTPAYENTIHLIVFIRILPLLGVLQWTINVIKVY